MLACSQVSGSSTSSRCERAKEDETEDRGQEDKLVEEMEATADERLRAMGEMTDGAVDSTGMAVESTPAEEAPKAEGTDKAPERE